MTVHALVYAAWRTSVLFALPSQNAFLFINFSSDSPCLGLCRLGNVCFICRLSTIPCIFIYISALTVRALVHAAWITSVLFTILSPTAFLFFFLFFFLFVNFNSDIQCLAFSTRITSVLFALLSLEPFFLSISAVTVHTLVNVTWKTSVLFALLSMKHLFYQFRQWQSVLWFMLLR